MEACWISKSFRLVHIVKEDALHQNQSKTLTKVNIIKTAIQPQIIEHSGMYKEHQNTTSFVKSLEDI